MKAFQRFSTSRKRDDDTEKKQLDSDVKPTDRPSTPQAPAADTTIPTRPSEPLPKQPDANAKPQADGAHPAVTPAPAAEALPASSNADPEKPSRPKVHSRGFSLRALLFIQDNDDSKPLSSTDGQNNTSDGKKKEASADSSPIKPPNKRAQSSAIVVRTVIVGHASGPSKLVAPGQLNKVKTQLMQRKSAKQIITALRLMPATPATTTVPTPACAPCAPIHAVCLPYTEQEAYDLHFSQLQPSDPAAAETEQITVLSNVPPSVSDASLDALSNMLKNMDVVNLLLTPDFGIGQPADGPGILSGALPTVGTVLNGIQQVTPELLALGFATGRALTPDHRGIYPPTDRMSVLTYWWGLELVLPPPTIKYLSGARSISNAVVNFLTALSLINGGVREILPFVRYVGQFVDFEFNAIRAEDKGKGVVCAATWLFPAAMVPRPWDFPTPPRSAVSTAVEQTAQAVAPVPIPQVIVTTHE